ncbi:Kelch repeat type 1 [Arabidopsis thaliana x Arabidopsis arenosa]|uniref:Kelch repeat type 1 n=1 Tax=Arabidopsis thaliana x Arabidopsis arenosa TaxID=1240361 RepID=A0A8T1Z075_9BRAS|nr:Kelch repeat type 1 [Arabidopsis thaliana x Arabidopsis arenosa]
MFTLWRKPGQILTNQLEKNDRSTGDARLVQIPSSYYSNVPPYLITVGSELYGLSQRNDPTSIMWVRKKEILCWRNSPNMTVARAKARAVVFNGKIYVMGGCPANESANWAEVFDPKTQIWEALPDPGPELRFSSIRRIEVTEGKLYVRSNEDKDSVYDPKEGKWDVAKKSHLQCIIGNIWCYCDKQSCWWYDKNSKEWRVVKGLDILNRNLGCGMIEVANYGEKLLILWDKVGPSQDKDIWCALIAIEKRDGLDEVWGKIEWASIVLTLPDSPSPSMFTLWIKPGQILTNQLEKNERSTGDIRLVQIPSSYYNNVPNYLIEVGSEVYGLSQRNDPSNMLVCDKGDFFWRKSINMTVARARALGRVLNGKIYVMGGCGAEESSNWGEVLDINTQTWEPLPDPGAELRFSSIRRIEVIQGKLYVRSNEKKDSVYDPKEGKWDVTIKSPVQCSIDNVHYYCDEQSCYWYDKISKIWRAVKGLDMLNRNRRCGMIEIANYDGKLLVLWDKYFVHPGTCQVKDIWCAVIALERRVGSDEVWGNIEWANIVLTVPSSYVFFSDKPCPSLFALWIKPGQTLTNQLEKKERSIGDTRLVPIPSSYCSTVPFYTISVGSEVYGLKQYNDPSSMMWVRNKKNLFWRKAPNMTVARAKAIAHVLNGKIYVMGGCKADESANWGEVFDIKTQTWEPLPDPGAELRFSSIRKIEVFKGKLYVRSNEKKDSVYDPEEGKWDVTTKSHVQSLIDNVWYCCDKRSCWWYDTSRRKWRVVKGLDMLIKNLGCGIIEIANYDGKLLILWDKFVHHGTCQDKDIWCALIALERRDGSDEVWGNIDWASIVLTVPSSYGFVNSLKNRIKELQGKPKPPSPLFEQKGILRRSSSMSMVARRKIMVDPPRASSFEPSSASGQQRDGFEQVYTRSTRRHNRRAEQVASPERSSTNKFDYISSQDVEQPPPAYYGVYLGLNGTKRSELDQGARLELEQDVTDTPRSELHQGARLELEQDVTDTPTSELDQGARMELEQYVMDTPRTRISRSHYPKLSLVCKTFRTLLISNELTVARLHLKTHETFFHVCLKFPDRPNPSMFTLWIRPGQILTNQLEKKQRSTGDTRLVQIPSSYYSNVPLNLIRVGSKVYGLRQSNDPSSNMLVRKKKSLCWHKAPNMTVARAKALACVLNGKIYVMGGCGADESANWGEVFDIKTQTWAPLPDPGGWR